MKLFDNRAFVSASLVNKTERSIAALKWVRTHFTGGGAALDFGIEALQEIDIAPHPDCSVTRGDYVPGTYKVQPPDTLATPGNTVWSGFDNSLGYATGALHIAGGNLGYVDYFMRMHKDTTIDEAWMSIIVADLERFHYHEIDGIGTTTTTLEDITFYLVRIFPGVTNFEVVAPIPFAGTLNTNQTIIINATAALQAVAADQSSTSIGYAIIASPVGNLSGDLVGVLEGLLNPLPTFSAGESACILTEMEITRLQWGSIHVGEIWLRITPPPWDPTHVVIPLWPVLSTPEA